MATEFFPGRFPRLLALGDLGLDVVQFCPAVQYTGVCERFVGKQSIAWPWSESARDKDRH